MRQVYTPTLPVHQAVDVALAPAGAQARDWAPRSLAKQMDHLQLSSRRLIWPNPVLRREGFAPRASGIRQMLPHVGSYRAGHAISALEALTVALFARNGKGGRERLLVLMR